MLKIRAGDSTVWFEKVYILVDLDLAITLHGVVLT